MRLKVPVVAEIGHRGQLGLAFSRVMAARWP